MADRTRSLPPADLSAVIGAYLEALDDGHAPNTEDLIARHPDLADDLRRFLAAQGAIEDLAAPFRSAATPALPGGDTLPTAADPSGVTAGNPASVVTAGEYVLREEVGRGGMGVVYRADDAGLGRRVAVKVLQERFHGDPAAARRFLAEARVTAELTHPGIPPVHAVGTLPDGRPFLTMKLIDGRTLADILASGGRQPPEGSGTRGADVPRSPNLVAVFEQVCQAVAFAHAAGVVHRDLKPANVMVGRFGETLVLDWGLARQSRIGEDRSAATRSGAAAADPDQTSPGAILGTPAFMAPEQARGEVADTRADVFGLGAVLCAILTGRPPYTGETTREVHRKAVGAELGEAFSRLDGCGAEPELVTLCKHCLAAKRVDRPRDAGTVAAAVARFRAAAEERARQAEVARGKAEVQAAEQRKRRKVQLALAAAVLVLLTGGGAFAWWQDRQRANEVRLEGERDAEARNKREQALQGVVANRAMADDLRKQYRFKAAEAALAQAAEAARRGAPELLPEVVQAQRDLAFVVELDDIRYRKWIWVIEPGGKGNFSAAIAPPLYQSAFAGRGLDLMALDPTEAARQIAAMPVKAELVAAVVDWALFAEVPVRTRLLSVARKIDPGPLTDGLFDPAVWNDGRAVAKLAAQINPAATSPTALSVLAGLMVRHELDPSPMLTAARAAYPSDFELAFVSGGWQEGNRRSERQIGPLEAARALRPENRSVWNNLGVLLGDQGDREAAIAAFKRAIELDPNDPLVHNNLAQTLKEKGDLDGAVAAYRNAIQADPKYAAAHSNLGVALRARGDVEGAFAAFNKAIELDPLLANAHNGLGNILILRHDLSGAIAAYREAVKVDPAFAIAHNNLGNALTRKGDLVGAIAAYRAAIKADPKHGSAYANLGLSLLRKGELDNGIAALHEAVRINPKDAKAHHTLGQALFYKRDLSGAIAALREATTVDPTHADAHNKLAWLLAVGLDEVQDGRQAAALATRACELTAWKNPEYIDTLAAACAAAGDFDRAVEYQKKALSFPEYEKSDGPAARQRMVLYGQKKAYRDPAVAALKLREVAPPPRAK